MKFELIKNPIGLEMYGDIPCLPVDVDDKTGERFIGEESDSWLLLEYFVRKIDSSCPNLLDYGDVDYFNRDKCKIIKRWLENIEPTENARLIRLFDVLHDYTTRAIELNTGVVIEL